MEYRTKLLEEGSQAKVSMEREDNAQTQSTTEPEEQDNEDQTKMTGTDSEVVIIDNSEASVWPEKHEEIFIELMEEEVLKGNRNTTTFTKQSWKRIKEELYAQAKRSYTDTQLRNKYNLLRQRHKDFKSLLKETGIGFSVVTGQVTAPDEVWDRLIRVNKSAKKFRKKGCVLYGKLCVIFGDTTATGSNAHPSTRSPSINLDNDDDDAMSKSPSIRNQESSFDEDGSKRRGKSTSTTSSRSAKKAKFSLALAETLTVYNETAKRKMEVYENSMTSTKHHLLDECIEALNQIDGISGEVYAKAIEKFESEVSRALFLKMPEHRRIDWLNYLKQITTPLKPSSQRYTITMGSIIKPIAIAPRLTNITLTEERTNTTHIKMVGGTHIRMAPTVPTGILKGRDAAGCLILIKINAMNSKIIPKQYKKITTAPQKLRTICQPVGFHNEIYGQRTQAASLFLPFLKVETSHCSFQRQTSPYLTLLQPPGSTI
ncbi:hypothetical protein F8388_022365 [Cannabis sativa]|uniref:Myb/SANT-like domain-containing protein n=5 Tax=Cannabis sativa TaxID=3483 RepID=A0A7J6G6H9_CANSA|nr:hypothetical protein F8388_022365 [Cannabis sativa]